MEHDRLSRFGVLFCALGTLEPFGRAANLAQAGLATPHPGLSFEVAAVPDARACLVEGLGDLLRDGLVRLGVAERLRRRHGCVADGSGAFGEGLARVTQEWVVVHGASPSSGASSQ